MKKLLTLLLIATVSFGMFACDSKDSDDNRTVDPIVGNWLSEGQGRVAFGLAFVSKTARITAEFRANQTYTVVARDSSGTDVTFSGTWEASEAATPSAIRSITLNQTVPSSVTATGIFMIEGGNEMTYEVIQSQPALDGVVPPTVAGGFGSTQINNAPSAIWIQRFARQ